MYKKLLWTLTFIFSLALSQMAVADVSICKEGLTKMVQSLNLDNTQKEKIKPILDQLKSDLQAAGSQMDSLKQQMDQQVYSAEMDQDKVDSLVDQKTKLIGDMMKAKFKAKSQIFAILNPQQKDKLQGMMKKVDEKMAAFFKGCVQD